MAARDLAYQHWAGRHEGLWRRRCVIAVTGLRACLGNRWARYLVAFCWLAALGFVAVLFGIGQLLVADSIIVQWAAHLDPQLQTFVRGLTTWLEQHPEISVGTTQNFLFYWFATFLVPFGIIALALALPHLITRDLASNAIVIYASKAISRFDYLLGKAGVVLGMLTLTWLGPVLAAWLAGNLLAPNWNFFWHSRTALLHALWFVVPGMLFLSLLGLAISAISSREKATVGLYVALWLVGNVFVPLGEASDEPRLKQLSFHYDLEQFALAIFKPATDLEVAQQNVPVLGQLLPRQPRRRAATRLQAEAQTWPALAAFGMVSVAIVLVRTKPE